MNELLKIPIDDMIIELTEEFNKRAKSYPKFVSGGTMIASDGERKIARIEAAIFVLELVKNSNRPEVDAMLPVVVKTTNIGKN